METLSSSFASLQLCRYPVRKKELLRAWDAADEYLLQHLGEERCVSASSRILIINDQFGALSLSLHAHQPAMISDSWLAHAGLKNNLTLNQLSEDCINLHTSLDYPEGPFDLVLIKVPKSLAMLEDQLLRLRPLLHTGSRVIAGGMAKAIHTSTLKLFEKHLGPTQTSLARKKARLIFPEISSAPATVTSPYPTSYTLEGTSHKIINHAAVFSRDSLDIGTRFFLEHLPVGEQYQKIIDLGCGNGIVGLMAADKNPSAELLFTDESFMAVASAEANFRSAFQESRHAEFFATDCLSGVAANSYDLVLNNPPFHQQNVVGDFIALQMFREAYKVLKKEGELWVIGNRHLGYHLKLKKLFGNCDTVAANKKFVILKAQKR